MKNKSFLFILIILLSNPGLNPLYAGNIVFPYRAAKTIVQNGDDFFILFNNTTASSIDSIILEGPFNRVLLTVDSVIYGRFEYDTFTKSSVNNKIFASIPSSVPEELYDLVVKTEDETNRSKKAVKVVKEFNRNHSFIHISDLHVSRNWVGTVDNGHAFELELFDRFVEVANIIAPDFIINTGDNIHETTRFDADSTGWGGYLMSEESQRPLVEEKWKSLYDGAGGFSGLNALNAPIFSIPGNHDYYGLPAEEHLLKSLQWNKMCGLRVYGFTYGASRFLMSDNCLGDPEVDFPPGNTMSGLQGRIFNSFLNEKGKGKVHVLAQHRYHDRRDGGLLIDTAFMNEMKINVLLHGHYHDPYHEYFGTTPTLGARPGTVCKSGCRDMDKELGYFRVLRINGSSVELSDPVRFIKDPSAPYEKMELNLALRFKNPNDGTTTQNTAVITNLLDMNFPDCHVRFIMKKGNYSVNRGKIYQVIESGNFSVVDVRTDAASNTVNEIKISLND